MNAAGGYVRLHRRLLDSAVWMNPRTLKVFLWALLRANYTERQVTFGGMDITLRAGQFISGRFAGATECGMRPSTFLYQITTLKTLGVLCLKSDNKKTLIIVVNYKDYQSDQQQANNKPTTSQQ